MTKAELNNWWAGLTVTQKERIATKAATKQNDTYTQVLYPACSAWWNTLDDERQQWLHDHCVDAHGYILAEFQEGRSMSY